jgi:predicted dehydrogenase
MKLNVAIIGCGDMGRNHATQWQAVEDAQIAAVSDPLDERRDKMVEDTGAAGYPEWKDAILHEGVNVVSVCTPVCCHSEIGVFAAEHGRHVLCEKPIALTLDQADEMIRAAKENNVLLSTSLQYRGFARNARYRRLIREGAFGGPIFVRYMDIREVRPKIAMHRKSMNGGPIIDMAGHYFDTMRYLTGEEPVSISAQGHVFGRGKERLASVDDFAVDAAEILVKMTGGHVLSAFINWGMPEGFKGFGGEEYIVGPVMSARLQGDEVCLRYPDREETFSAKEGNPPGSSVRINDLAAAIREGRQPEVTGEDGRIALSVSLAALESIETGEVVKL